MYLYHQFRTTKYCLPSVLITNGSVWFNTLASCRVVSVNKKKHAPSTNRAPKVTKIAKMNFKIHLHIASKSMCVIYQFS